MNKKITAITALALLSGSMAFSNTPLITNTTFEGYPDPAAFTGWIVGANIFELDGTWIEFVQAPDAFTYETVFAPNGNGFDFTNWDDLIHDQIETFMFNEYFAGPADSLWPSQFEAGDVIVFKGSHSAVRTGNDPSDMTVQAFAKFLGYNSIGWDFQVKEEYSAFAQPGTEMTDFELRVTMPDLTVDDSLQVLQLGFQISGKYDGSGFDMATIYFENIEGYLEGDGPTWAGYPIVDGYANTGDWLGFLELSGDPVVYSVSSASYLFITQDVANAGSGWIYSYSPASLNIYTGGSLNGTGWGYSFLYSKWVFIGGSGWLYFL